MISKKLMGFVGCGFSALAALLSVAPSSASLAFTSANSSGRDSDRSSDSVSAALDRKLAHNDLGPHSQRSIIDDILIRIGPVSGSRSVRSLGTSSRTAQGEEPMSFYDEMKTIGFQALDDAGILRITSDQTTGDSVLNFVVDSNAVVTGMTFTTTSANSAPSTLNFSLTDIGTGDGVVLMQKQGHNVFYLRGTVDSAAGTGSVVIRYLANGLWGTYKECPATVGRTSDGAWHIYNQTTSKIVTDAKVETWSLGVTTVHGICLEPQPLLMEETSEEL